MNRKTITIILLFAVICLLCPAVGYLTDRTISFRIRNGNEIALNAHFGSADVIIRPFYNDRDRTYYYFLPNAAGTHRIFGNIGKNAVRIDGKSVGIIPGFSWEEGRTYEVAWNDISYNARFVTTSDIPALFITTDSFDVEKINTDKSYVETGSVAVVEQGGRVSYKGGMSIKGRGNFTYEMFNKRGFHLTLDDPADILGMMKNRDWILLANSADYSYMNNKLAFDMAKGAGFPYSPDAEYADVYFNGEYWGLYLIAEKIKIGSGRINITDLEKENLLSPSGTPSDITGGYLLERDYRTPDEKQVPSWFITKDFDTHVRIRSPEYATDEETRYISGLVNEMEQAIDSEDGYSSTGKYYLDYIDLDSWVKYYIIAEISHDGDLGTTSTYFYKDRDDIDPKIYMGPCWDFDQAFGGDPSHSSPEVLFKCPDTWFWELYDRPEFHEQVVKTWNSYFSNYLENEAPYRIATWREQIRASVVTDNIRWNRFDGYEKFMSWPRGDGSFTHDYSYDDEVDHFAGWLARRHDFLDKCWQ